MGDTGSYPARGLMFVFGREYKFKKRNILREPMSIQFCSYACIPVFQLRNCREMVMPNLESALAQQAPPAHRDDPSLHELPPLVIDGIPTPVDKMTQVCAENDFST